MANAITNWSLANQWEESGEVGPVTFILRSAYMDLISHTLVLCLGREAALSWIKAIRRICHSEGLDGYRENLAKQFEGRR